ncbi:hypothetical protein C2G38_2124338 [Gigaspora rosea]|uniref:Uncharacterized protein n=1 Tax=Gigaspora rosea TaxID=44941 RepID=A0A397U0Z7_9GLOM|nr:hypothetical protein C2G38_2124338 [Gigaspora rosea]
MFFLLFIIISFIFILPDIHFIHSFLKENLIHNFGNLIHIESDLSGIRVGISNFGNLIFNKIKSVRHPCRDVINLGSNRI